MARPKPIIVSSQPLSMDQSSTSASVDLGPIFDFFKRKREEKAAQEAESKVQSLFDRSSGEITQTGGLQSASEEIFPSQAPKAQQFNLEALAEGLRSTGQPQPQQAGLDIGALARIAQQAQNPLGQPQAAPQEQAPFRLENLLPTRTPQVDIPSQEVVLPPSEQQRAAFEGLGLTGTEGIKQRALGFGGQAFPEPEVAGDPKNAAVPENVRAHLSKIYGDIPIPEGTTYGQLSSQGIKAENPAEVTMLSTPVSMSTTDKEGNLIETKAFFDSEGKMVSRVPGRKITIPTSKGGSPEQQKTMSKLLQADAAINSLDLSMDRYFTEKDPASAKLGGGLEKIASFVGGDSDLAKSYLSAKQGLITLIGKGAFAEDRMTDFDADRIEGLIPDRQDSRSLARFKMGMIKAVMENAIQNQKDVQAGTFDVDTARARSKQVMQDLFVRRLTENNELEPQEKQNLQAQYAKEAKAQSIRDDEAEIRKLKASGGK